MKRPKTSPRKDGRYSSYYYCPHHYTADENTVRVATNYFAKFSSKNGRPVSMNSLQGQIVCNKKLHTIYTANKSDLAYQKAVEIHLAKHERKLYEEKQARPSASKTIAEINEKFKAHCKKLEGSKDFSKHMNANRERVARLYILPELGETAVGRVTEKDLIFFFDNLHSHFINAELGDILYLHVQVTLKAIFNFAYIRDYIKENPVTAKVNATATDNRKKIKESYVSNRGKWTSETVDLVTNFVYFLIDKSKSDNYYQKLSEYMMLTLHIGTRASETAGIQLDDFDIENNKIHIQRQLVKMYGIYSQPLPEITKLKTKQSYRKIPISTDVKKLFLRIEAEYEEGLRKPDIFGNRSLWQNDDGVPLHAIDFSTMLLRFLRNYGKEFESKFGGKYQFKFHALRHACISTWIMSGVNINIAKYWAGHSSIQMTADRYGHLVDSREQQFDMSDVLQDKNNNSNDLGRK